MKSPGNYIFLSAPPPTPPQKAPHRSECAGHEFITMVQLCNIAEKLGLTRRTACYAFGGDRGVILVEPARMARAAFVGKQLRKYVLVSAVEDFFQEKGIAW